MLLEENIGQKDRLPRNSVNSGSFSCATMVSMPIGMVVALNFIFLVASPVLLKHPCWPQI